MNIQSKAIGVFDSGLGGLTAVRQIRELLPHEDIIYFGDTGRLPYGTRSRDMICKYALDDMNFLVSQDVKAVVVACGTVSSTALDAIKAHFDLPVIGVVEPASVKALSLSKNKKIGIFATSSTVRSGSFDKTVRAHDKNAESFGIGCPMFVPLVENGYIGDKGAVTKQIADEYAAQMKAFSPDVVILGCTHYPIIRDIIEASLREQIGDVKTVDSGYEAAVAAYGYLRRENLLNDTSQSGRTSYYVSDDPCGFEKVASLFLGRDVRDVTRIDIQQYAYGKTEQ